MRPVPRHGEWWVVTVGSDSEDPVVQHLLWAVVAVSSEVLAQTGTRLFESSRCVGPWDGCVIVAQFASLLCDEVRTMPSCQRPFALCPALRSTDMKSDRVPVQLWLRDQLSYSGHQSKHTDECSGASVSRYVTARNDVHHSPNHVCSLDEPQCLHVPAKHPSFKQHLWRQDKEEKHTVAY